MKKLINDYKNAVELEGYDLLAVEMSDGGWSIAENQPLTFDVG